MIDIFDALGWLNAIDRRTYLSSEATRLVKIARMVSLKDASVRPLLLRLRNKARSSKNSLERAELLINCAVIGEWRGWMPEAFRDATAALNACDKDNHRRAVALWILGMVQWETDQNHEAYKSWATARELFREQQKLFRHHPQEESWYGNRIREMDIELVARPEEIGTWLNHFERPSLRPKTEQIVRRVQEKARNHTYLNAYALMRDLEEARNNSEEFHEAAEVALEFGLAIYQIGNTHVAIELLRKAVRDFYPGFGVYHKQTVARCMLGAVEWQEKPFHNQAATHWNRCLEEFEKLRWWAERDRCLEKEKWYARRCDILRAALLDRVRPPTPFPPQAGVPGPTDTPPAPPPSRKQRDPYDDLLNMVHWERALADRLIEYERKKAPTADRAVWIKRAMERWLRQNR